MTPEFSCLRQVEPARMALDAARRRCQRAGIETGLVRLDPSANYLRFSTRDACATAFYVDMNHWVSHRMPALSGMGWAAMPDRDVDALLGATDGGPRFRAPALAALPLRFAGVLRQPASREMLTVDSGDGPVVFDTAPELPANAAAPVHTTWMAACRLPVDIRQGVIELTARTLRRAAPGDVLLLTRQNGMALVGTRSLFSFTRTMDTLSVDDIFDTSFLSSADTDTVRASVPGGAITEPGMALDGLTVTVDVVVARVHATLAELADLRPGSVFDLGQAGDAVRLDLGGATIATGELVQAGDRLGVLLHRIGKT